MSVMHPAYLAIIAAERCWSPDERTAQERTKVVVNKLVEAGILTDGEMRGGIYTRTNAIAGEPRRGLV